MPLPRRPLAFSLRTLLVLVTLACILGGWLANEWRFVKKRDAFMRSYRARMFVVSGRHLEGYDSWLRQSLGDWRVEWIEFRDPNTDRQTMEQTAALFPEAQVTSADLFHLLAEE